MPCAWQVIFAIKVITPHCQSFIYHIITTNIYNTLHNYNCTGLEARVGNGWSGQGAAGKREQYGDPDVIFGTSETSVQGTMVTSGTIIVSQVTSVEELMVHDMHLCDAM